MIHPILSKTYPLEQAGQAAYEMHHNLHAGKIGVLVLAPEEGLGVRDHTKRAKHAHMIELYRRLASSSVSVREETDTSLPPSSPSRTAAAT